MPGVVGAVAWKVMFSCWPDAVGSKDHWSAEARAPTLARLVPLLRLVVPPGEAAALVQGLSGTLNADVEANGRWPELTSKGQASLASVRAGSTDAGSTAPSRLGNR
jgi:hypothetical protein